MGYCCALISKKAVKVIAIFSMIAFALSVVAFVFRLTSEKPDTKNDLLGISVGGSLLLASVILYSGAVESAAGRCEIWLAVMLIFCGLQIPSMSDTIQYWETQGLLLLLVDVVQVVLIVCFIPAVYLFTKASKIKCTAHTFRE